MEILLGPLAVLALVFPIAGAILLNLRSGRAAKKRHTVQAEHPRREESPQPVGSTTEPQPQRKAG